MTVFTYQDAPAGAGFEVKSSAGAADASGPLVVTSLGVVNINAPVITGNVTNSGNVVFTSTVALQGVTSIGGTVTIAATLGFSGALVCAMTTPVTVSGVQGANTLIINTRLRIQSGSTVYYLYGGTSAQ